MSSRRILATFSLTLAVAASLPPAAARAQTALNLAALKGLLPFSTLLATPAGQAALKSNYDVTGAIQTGTAGQPALQPLAQQREQALKDAFITNGNALQLADGLGTSLEAAYRAKATYTSTDDGATSTFTNVSPNVATLLAYTSALSAADSASAKNFFGNETVLSKSGSAPVSKAAADLMSAVSGVPDVIGTAYAHPAGSAGADPLGDSRPFQTEKNFVPFTASDYFGVTTSNGAYLSGPLQDLTSSPSFPSGHTTYGYTESLLLAIMVPQRFSQMIVRGAEYGNSRIVLGAHYAMDVIGGRTLAYYDVAHLLAADPAYVGRQFRATTITDYGAALKAATADLDAALATGCGKTIAVCAAQDTSRFRDQAVNAAFYASTQTYGLAVVHPANVGKPEDVATLAPEAGTILTAAFPNLTLAQADKILTDTEGPGGGFLDDGSAFGIYSRLDLYSAGLKAAAL